jgi:hypothetical protein
MMDVILSEAKNLAWDFIHTFNGKTRCFGSASS